MAVNKERVKLLVDTLRSGKYKQGEGYLRTHNNEFCCLGVACEVYRKEAKQGRWRHNDDGDWEFVTTQRREQGVLPLTVRDWFGFPSADPYISDNETSNWINASTANDMGEWDFNRIADGFERVYLKEREDAKQS